MNFRISSTFSDSLARLTGQEQKAVKQTAFDLQLDPTGKGKSFHRIDRAKDPNFWSVRVTRDIRLIVHKTDDNLLLCYVDHHDDAYSWAERRKIERHPRTGAAQLVEIRETVREVEVEVERPVAAPAESRIFADTDAETLLDLGIPPEWIQVVQEATESTLLDLTDHIPQEAAEALLELAYGAAPEISAAIPEQADMFSHPDAERRFRVLNNIEELEQALEYPWEKWTVFLHPAQRSFATKRFNGPARVSGSAGTGKTVVALHRAVELAKTYPDDHVLLTTFSPALARALEVKLDRLIPGRKDLRDRIDVLPIKGVGRALCEQAGKSVTVTPDAKIKQFLVEAAAAQGETRFTPSFLWSEWNDVYDAWCTRDWDTYRDVARLGRKTRLSEAQRKSLWGVFQAVLSKIEDKGWCTWPMVFERVTEAAKAGEITQYRRVVVDEAQDIGVPELRFLAALAGEVPDGLFFAGDLGQRIFQTPFSWRSLGVDIRGRSHTLKVNYRTSHQIRTRADRLLPEAIADVDGNAENRRGAVSVFNGPPPVIDLYDDEAEESEAVASWISRLLQDGVEPEEIGLIVRSRAQIDRATHAARSADAPVTELGDDVEVAQGTIAISTMHWAKGLEFKAVCVMACDDEVLPLQSRIESVGDLADLEDVYNTERHLLYVACTRARDHLLITGVDPASEFLDDMG